MRHAPEYDGPLNGRHMLLEAHSCTVCLIGLTVMDMAALDEVVCIFLIDHQKRAIL